MIKDLLLHVLTILLPILTMQGLLLRSSQTRHTGRNKVFVGLLSGLAAILCMTFPVRFEVGVIWDFRWIPWMFAMLYGGYPAGLIGVAISIGYRLFLGGPGAIFAVFGHALAVIAPLLLASGFLERTRLQRYILGAGASLLAYGSAVLNTVFYLNYADKLSALPSYMGVFVYSGLLQLVLSVLCTFFIENAIEVAKLKSGIMRIEQLMMVSELAASVTHEVRNPLTVVRGFLQLAKLSVDPKVNSYMDMAIAELDRAEFIISDYLSLAKPQLERIEQIAVKEKLEGIASLMSSFAAMHGVSLLLKLEPGLAIRADGGKLDQVVLNLVKNAVEAIRGSGEITIGAYALKDNVVIEVADNGEGMKPEQLARLGSTYYSTKQNGTGLGTMVAFRLVEAMGGKLEYASALGRGTTARITLRSDAPGLPRT